MARFVLALALAATAVHGLYDASDAVVQLSDSDFDKKVLKSDGIWLVEVYAPWCGHCKSLAPEWKKAAKALKGIVNIAAVDGTAAQAVAQKLGVQGFPTIKMFGENKGSPVEYTGGRDASSIVQWAMQQAGQVAQKRLSGGGAGGSKGGKAAGGGGKGGKAAGGGGGKGKASGGSPGDGPGAGAHIVTVTEDNFEDEVLAAGEPVFLEFYAPWCGHCKTLAPEYEEAAAEVGPDAKFAAVDATVHGGLASQFGVKGYPTIVVFPGGKKTKKSATPYNGGRTAKDLVAAARELVETTGGATPAVTQLTSAEGWAEACGGKKLCLVSFLPHILDDGAAKRNGRLEVLTEAARKVGKRQLFSFVWAQAGDHPGLEDTLNVGMVPAVFAVSDDKKVFTAYRGAFDVKHLSSFVTGLVTRNGDARPLPADFAASAALARVEAWDGKDGKAQAAADEISLDDLEL